LIPGSYDRVDYSEIGADFLPLIELLWQAGRNHVCEEVSEKREFTTSHFPEFIRGGSNRKSFNGFSSIVLAMERAHHVRELGEKLRKKN
jgi:hypothetical protein